MSQPGYITWLILAYRLPARHSLKITVRRRLTAIGAVFPVNAVAAVPASSAAERAFRQIRRMIGEAGRGHYLHAARIRQFCLHPTPKKY